MDMDTDMDTEASRDSVDTDISRDRLVCLLNENERGVEKKE